MDRSVSREYDGRLVMTSIALMSIAGLQSFVPLSHLQVRPPPRIVIFEGADISTDIWFLLIISLPSHDEQFEDVQGNRCQHLNLPLR
jgi:hypothetical protein